MLAAVGVGVAIAASGGGHSSRAVATAPRTAVATELLLSRPWTLRAVRDHGRVLAITYTEGDCWGASRVRVTQKQKSVTIELLQSFSGGGVAACPQFLLVRDLQVHLRAPLSHRRLIHARLSGSPALHAGVIPPPGVH